MKRNALQSFIFVVLFECQDFRRCEDDSKWNTELSTSNSYPRTKQYRTDYEYSSQTDAFYKLHIEATKQIKAVEVCKGEGGLLLIPTSEFDVAQVHGMMKRFPDINFVYIGDDGQKHESAEEQPLIDLASDEDHVGVSTCDVISKSGDINTVSCWKEYPFVCKVDAKDAVYDDQCKVYGSQYIYNSAVGSCYKVPSIALNWDAAYAECEAQEAHLIVLNSAQECQVIKEFLKTAPRVDSSRADYFYFAGIRAQRGDRTFRTIFNKTLEEAGFSEWSDSEPNNYQDSEYCGTIFRNNGKYNDVNCAHTYGFICEKEVHI